MFGKTTRLNPLASRKQLLVAESDLNRARLVEEWQAMAGEVHALTDKAKTFGWLASAATLVASLPCFRRNKAAAASGSPSWLQTILNGAGLVSTVWQTFRPKDRGQKDK